MQQSAKHLSHVNSVIYGIFKFLPMLCITNATGISTDNDTNNTINSSPIKFHAYRFTSNNMACLAKIPVTIYWLR